MEAVAQQTEIAPEKIIGKGRGMEVVDARCILFCILREQGLYATQIAQIVNRTPVAVRYLLSKIDDRIKANKMVRSYLDKARKQLENK